MKKVLQGLQHLENLLLVITFAIMVIACFIQVVNRNIFRIPVSGFEEAAKYCMVYMVLLGTELGLRDGTQISVTAVVDKLHGKAKKVLQVIAKIIVVGFSGIMFKCGVDMVIKQAQTGQKSPGLGIPMTIPYFALVLSFALITVVQFAMLVKIIMDFNKPESEEPTEPQAIEEEGTK